MAPEQPDQITAAAAAALKQAEADHVRERDGALEHPDVRGAQHRVEVERTAYWDLQRQRRRAEIDAAEHARAVVADALAEARTTVAAARSHLATEEARQQRLENDHDAVRRKIADLTPKARKRVIVDFTRPDLDPDVPPAELALVRPDAWQQLFRDARARRTVSAITWISEVLGAVLEVEHHTAK